MKTILALCALLIVSCGKKSEVKTYHLSGVGIVENIESIDYVGVALNDSSNNLLLDISENRSAEVGQMIRYEATYTPSNSIVAGHPLKVKFFVFELEGRR